jgi:hypothetical protein
MEGLQRLAAEHGIAATRAAAIRNARAGHQSRLEGDQVGREPPSAEPPGAAPRDYHRFQAGNSRPAMSTLIGILILVAVVWIVIVVAAHLPIWLLALLLILVLVAFLG